MKWIELKSGWTIRYSVHLRPKTVCISDSQNLPASSNISSQAAGAEERYEVDHFDGDLVHAERSQPTDNIEDRSRRSDDKERTTQSRGKDFEKGCDQSPAPTVDRTLSAAPPPEDKFERSSRGDSAGLKDGDRHRTRRKEMTSWADEMEDRLEHDQKTYSAFEYDLDGGQSSRKDIEARGAAQYSRQDRRKRQPFTYLNIDRVICMIRLL